MDAKLLQTVRKVNGLSQYEMAEKLGVSRSMLAKVEAGYRNYPEYLTSRLIEEFGEEHIGLIKRIKN